MIRPDHTQSTTLHQGSGHLVPGAMEDAGKGWAGDAHAFSGLLLIELFLISQSKRLYFVGRQGVLRQFTQRNSRRLKVGDGRHMRNYSGTNGTWHMDGN